MLLETPRYGHPSVCRGAEGEGAVASASNGASSGPWESGAAHVGITLKPLARGGRLRRQSGPRAFAGSPVGNMGLIPLAGLTCGPVDRSIPNSGTNTGNVRTYVRAGTRSQRHREILFCLWSWTHPKRPGFRCWVSYGSSSFHLPFWTSSTWMLTSWRPLRFCVLVQTFLKPQNFPN